ncbi:MAG TPA: L,D-transpeptidase family protein [Longimicrobium sp.]|nr:L,D-transpeptidase family protein [Longimicrobium sp.]
MNCLLRAAPALLLWTCITPAAAQDTASQRAPAAQRTDTARPAQTQTTTQPVVVRPTTERWTHIARATVNARPARFPIGKGHAGPSVLRVQILLDRALFSPGMMDGRWGRNTESAVHWLQTREGLPATGVVDEATMRRIEELAAAPDSLVTTRKLDAAEVRGPFVQIPSNIYRHARLSCSCYESLTEKLTESFHVSADVLRKLNPGIRLDGLKAGDSIAVPAIRAPDARATEEVTELRVSGSGRYLHAVSAAGRILYHFPTTLGSTFDPSPLGDFTVSSIHADPWWHYQPRILAHVPDDRPSARIPPGPNNAVGTVWMALSAPHYGIHGTKSPETIGYATSAGCVRLTNWDASFLSRRLPVGTPVRFEGTRPAPSDSVASPDSAPPRARAGSAPR